LNLNEKAPAYSDDMPYSVKVRKRIQKEVAKRAEAEQRSVDLEEKLAEWKKELMI
jgi:ATP-dependent Lon protease